MIIKYKDMWKKILITLCIIGLYRAMMIIPLPGVNLSVISSYKSGFLKVLNVFSGGGIEKCSILAVNIMPYITASIVTQFLSSRIGLDYFKNLKKDQELGASKMNQYSQYFTVLFAVFQAIYLCEHLFATQSQGISAVFISKGMFLLQAIPLLVAGCILVVWISHQISKYGVGQGTQIIIFANIIGSSSNGAVDFYKLYQSGVINFTHLFSISLFFLFIFLTVVFVEGCKIEIPVYYPGLPGKNLQQTLPFKINNAGVIPSVLASTIVHLPVIILSYVKKFLYVETLEKIITYFSPGGIFYFGFSAILLFALTITQTKTVFDPSEIASNLQESGCVVADIRPGKDTEQYLESKINKLNIISGLYLVFICVISEYYCYIFNSSIGMDILHLSGTSILILVNIAQLIYKGMLDYNYQETTNKFIS